ncbi:MAG: Na/Pi cotransporter family protein [Fidelibacterota bacterium]
MKAVSILLGVGLVPGTLWASDGTGVPFSWAVLLMTTFGGLALFLYGLRKMSEGMKKAAGNRMRSILTALTHNRVVALLLGAFVTMVIQSSSATTVMLVSFVQAELMTFVQTLGIILGADIGTTITAQLIAFRITDYALLMIAVGFSFTMFARKDSHKNLGEAVLGFGILFFGMHLMSDAMAPLKTYGPFIRLLRGLESPLVGLAAGTLLTALLQSSSAFIGIVIVLAQQGVLTLEAGIPLIFGANIGTCVTAALASIGAKREAKLVAMAHVLFKVGGVILFVLWIPQFADLVRWLSPSSEGSTLHRLALETPRQIANAHTVFNVSLAVIFLPFTLVFARLVNRFLPYPEKEEAALPVSWRLDETSISTPALALNLARSEILRMIRTLSRMLEGIIHPFLGDEPKPDPERPQLSLIEGIQMREHEIDFLVDKTSDYLLKITRQELSDEQANEAYAMLSVAKDIESIGDIIDKMMIPLVAKKKGLAMDFSPAGREELEIYHVKVMKQISRLREAFETLDPRQAAKIMTKEEKYTDLESEYRVKHLERVGRELTESVATHEVHMELMDLLKQINVYTAHIARTLALSLGT